MTACFLIAVTASFASNSKRSGRSAFALSGTYCISAVTDQTVCSVTLTGPVCTVTLDHSTAYGGFADGPTIIPCTVPLRQP